MVCTPVPRFSVFSPVQPSKAESPIETRLFGSTSTSILGLFISALLPMVSRPSGKVTLVSCLPAMALSPICSTATPYRLAGTTMSRGASPARPTMVWVDASNKNAEAGVAPPTPGTDLPRAAANGWGAALARTICNARFFTTGDARLTGAPKAAGSTGCGSSGRSSPSGVVSRAFS